MSSVKAVVVACDIVTAYGWGIDDCWQGLLSRQSAISSLDRFSTKSFQTENAAIIPDLKAGIKKSLVMQMLTPLLRKASSKIPDDALLILSTTTGEIDLLERYVLNAFGDPKDSRLDSLLKKVATLSGVNNPGIIISAACASSSAAIAQAASMIHKGEHDCLMVVACDCVSEFVMAGFSSLMALDSDMARPFDASRKGLSLGEAAGFILLMDKTRAVRENRPILGEIAGWGLTNDANHMTGPSREGGGLALAIQKAFQKAGISSSTVGCIAAHGTGTVYNDSMEMKAFKKCFKNIVPTYSIKGGTGHTMGAAGLVEIVIALRSLKEGIVPPTVNINTVDDEARGWVSSESCLIDSAITLSTNSGFGGVNAALILMNNE